MVTKIVKSHGFLKRERNGGSQRSVKIKEENKKVSDALKEMGWTVVTVWECETKEESELKLRVSSLFKKA